MSNEQPLLTKFQQTAEHSIAALLLGLGRKIDSREVLQGVVPFFSKEPQTVLKLTADDLVVWLYDDEASFSARAGGGAVERLDFKSEPELLNKLLQQIEASLRT